MQAESLGAGNFLVLRQRLLWELKYFVLRIKEVGKDKFGRVKQRRTAAVRGRLSLSAIASAC